MNKDVEAAKKTIKCLKKNKKLFSFLKENNVRYRFDPKLDGGFWQYNSEQVRITTGAKYHSYDDLIANVLHEYIHVFCYRNKIYTKYHAGKASKSYLRRMALKIERDIDKRAARLMKELFPKRKYRFAYGEPGAREWLLGFYGIKAKS